VQLIDEKTAGQPTSPVYTIKDRDTFVDFCVGPHVPSTNRLKAFKLTSTLERLLKGDAHNQPMQRVYGTAFFKEDDLKQHLTRIEEAKKRDHPPGRQGHRLFTFHPCAPGAAVLARQGHDALQHPRQLHARGALPRRLLGVEDAADLQQAALGDSGHWQHYRQNMFLVESENVEMGVKAMNCPGHMLVFASQSGATATCRSATTSRRRCTATRPRACSRPDPRAAVLAGRRALLRHGVADRRRGRAAAESGQAVYRDFGLQYQVKLATRPRRVSSARSPTWDHAEAELEKGLEAAGVAYVINEATAPFTARKSISTSSTRLAGPGSAPPIQLDYQMPPRFDLKYIGPTTPTPPVVIHRRFSAVSSVLSRS
jgi:threonyl-tRNA synthetase